MDNFRSVAFRNCLFFFYAALGAGLLAAVFVGVALAAPPEQPPTPTSPSGGGGGSGGGGLVTPTVHPPPWEIEPTPAPVSVICSVAPPAWWGQVTPSAYWWFLCGECVQRWGAAAWPRYPTPTPPYIFPTVVFPTPVTPGPSPTPGLSPTPGPSPTPGLSPTLEPSPTPGPLATPTSVPSYYAGPVTGTRRFEAGNPVFCRHSWWLEPHPRSDTMIFGVYRPCGEYEMLLIYAGGQENSRLEGVVISTFVLEFERERPPWPNGQVPPGVIYYPPISVTYYITYLIPFESTNLVRLATSGGYHTLSGYASVTRTETMSFLTNTMTLQLDGQQRVVHALLRLEIYFPRLSSPVSSRGGQFEIRARVNTCSSVPTPTPTPTPTPVITATPTPSATSSLCDDPFVEGTPYRIFEPPRLGEAYCLEFGPYDWTLLGVSIPKVTLCAQEIYFGKVNLLGVSINLDLIAGILVGVALVRWIASFG